MSGTELHHNEAGGDIAGGNIDKSSTHIEKIEINNIGKKSALRNIVEKLEADCIDDPNFNKYISNLIHYTSSVHPNEQRDLETKLKAANRQDELYDAQDLKERFTKLLTRSSLSEQAQNAYVHILSKLKLDYDHKVKPLLKSAATLVDIEAKVSEVVIGIYEDLEGTVLEHNVREIKGMLYYLTGNCHIEWKY